MNTSIHLGSYIKNPIDHPPAIRIHSQVIMDTIERIKAYYAAFNQEDHEGMLAHLTDDVVHDINQGDAERGIDSFRAFLGRMQRCYRERLENIVVMSSADGTRAAAEFTVHGTYLVADEGLPPAHGQSYILPAGAFFSLTQGKISRVTVYYNLPDWIRQVS